MLLSCVTWLLLLLAASLAEAQLSAFHLPPQQGNYAKPTITPELSKYFELDGHARELVDTLLGPRPGYFPEKTYEVSQAKVTPSPGGVVTTPDGLTQIGKAVEQFLSGPAAPSPSEPQQGQLPPGFAQGFSFGSGGKNTLTSFQQNANPSVEERAMRASLSNKTQQQGKSSVSGIPNSFPKLPKFPFSAMANQEAGAVDMRKKHTVVMKNAPEIPKIIEKPEIPEGGLGLAGSSDVRRHPSSVSEALSSNAADASEYGALSDEPRTPGGLIGTILDLFSNKDGKPADANGIGKAVTNLLGGSNSPLPAKNMISNVLYKALTSGSIQSNSTEIPPLFDFNSSTPITLTAAQQAAIGENLEMIQNLIAQPSSPLCNPKPVPVSEFNIDAFMGQWYQVIYSPPLTKSACSVVSYKKLADVNDGGIGSIFEIFEYTTDGTPYAKPKITSGYAILKQPGELIFRTTAHQEDVNVHVIFNGPINTKGEYDFTIMTTNCNYPVYVFARDPVVYKQRYEMAVNQILESKGIVNGFSKLLNIVSPVDASTCTFPPSLFNNVKG